jgi:hypothetical protein
MYCSFSTRFSHPHIEIIEAELPDTILGNFVSRLLSPRLAKARDIDARHTSF